MGKAVTIGLVGLLVLSVLGNVLLFAAYSDTSSKLSELENKTRALEKSIVPGVRLTYDGKGLVVENSNITSVYIKPFGVYVLDKGSHIFTKNSEFELDIAVYGGYFRDSWGKIKLTPGVHYKCLSLNARDGLRVTWKVFEGDPKDLKIRLFNETGFEIYKGVMQNYEPGNPESAANLLVVEMEYQLMGSTPENVEEGGFYFVEHGPGKYCVVFENWGREDIILGMYTTIERTISISDR